MRIILSAILGLGLAACGQSGQPPAQPVSDPATIRVLDQGEVIGSRTARGAEAWRGLAFAAPPVGDLRWRAPRPVLAHEGVFEALESPDRCAQITNGFDSDLEPDQLIGGEDCLYLDIYAPPGASDRDLPVMVFIHGGANTWGYAGQYDGSQLALDQDVIVAVIQYRLGPLGWFAIPALRADAQMPEDAAANFALLDQIAALAWVRDNISVFGGDPQRVTIFGESAGAQNVLALMASPLADGLFHRAIAQSGTMRSVSLARAEGTQPLPASALDEIAGLEAGARFAGANAPASALRAASLEDIFAAYGEADMPRVIEDGVTLPVGGMRAAFADPQRRFVPLITGSNRDESRLYLAFDPEFTKTTFGVIRNRRDPARYVANGDYGARLWRLDGVDDAADRLVAAGHDRVWAYRFDWDEGGSLLFTDTGALLGAAHSMELPFVFNDFSILYGDIGKVLFTNANAEGRQAVANAMGAYWGAFARAGDPNAGEGEWLNWPVWQAGGRLLRFDTPADGGVDVLTGNDDWARLTAEIIANQDVTAADRCAIAGIAAMRDVAAGEAMHEAFGCEPAGAGDD
ncbi:para-nitrobenzyl esterase [Maricaulis salignorans]|uniref:Carboxylic ester hydrolase n=1 Tax=Maricaulis salignorans TaxID=144026 RepID=A0A1G9V733_9PROT|nr:para-nitrobenzyl esterase [Maricaulis salignorans]